MKLKIGTHNSMSYLPPKKWYLYPFRFMARCQSKSIEDLIKLGAGMVDIRVAFDKHGNPEFRHGSMAYKGDVLSVLWSLNKLKSSIWVRLILENSKYSKNLDKLIEYFTLLCTYCENNYTNLKFFCGRRKFDWKLIYKFKHNGPKKIVLKISSMTWKKWDDWFPWLYARVMNHKNISSSNDTEWLLIDFIEIQ